MKSASDYQVGGDHYRSEYQHWDWAIDIRLGYLESATTKYVTRWKGKNGPQDVEKAIHYLTKAKDAYLERRLHNGSTMLSPNKSLAALAGMNTERFCAANSLTIVESRFMMAVATWKTEVNLDTAIELAYEILAMAVDAAQGRKDGAGTGTAPKASRGAGGQKTGAAGRAGGTTTQPPASSTSTEPHNKATDGMEHPFGYDERAECDFTQYRPKK